MTSSTMEGGEKNRTDNPVGGPLDDLSHFSIIAKSLLRVCITPNSRSSGKPLVLKIFSSDETYFSENTSILKVIK